MTEESILPNWSTLSLFLDIFADHHCHCPPAFFGIPLGKEVLCFSPGGAGYADSSAGACADAFGSQWASAYLIKWLSKQTVVSGNCTASYSQWENINFWSGSFWVPSAQTGCQKTQLSKRAGIVRGYSMDEYKQNTVVAYPPSVIALIQPFRGLPADIEKNLRNQSRYIREWCLSTLPPITSAIFMKTLLLEGSDQVNPSLCWGWPDEVPGSAAGRCISWQLMLDWPDLNWCSKSESCHDNSPVSSVWNRIHWNHLGLKCWEN